MPLATLMGLFRPPAPQPPDASAAAINAAVSAAAAQRHLLQVRPGRGGRVDEVLVGGWSGPRRR